MSTFLPPLTTNGATVDDCIALALGGNQVYANVLTNNNIMLFLTPMVAAHGRI